MPFVFIQDKEFPHLSLYLGCCVTILRHHRLPLHRHPNSTSASTTELPQIPLLPPRRLLSRPEPLREESDSYTCGNSSSGRRSMNEPQRRRAPASAANKVPDLQIQSNERKGNSICETLARYLKHPPGCSKWMDQGCSRMDALGFKVAFGVPIILGS